MKYKAWDTFCKRWRDEFDWVINPETGKPHRIHDLEFYQVEATQLVLCRQTPLSDTTGKAIFEGDILIFQATTCTEIHKGYAVKPYQKGQVFVVKRLDTGFSLSIPEILDSVIPNQVGHVDPYTFWNHQRSFRVIGNVFENPDLITTPI
jgi:uncharacterized phage protein (TIGR01671 family)